MPLINALNIVNLYIFTETTASVVSVCNSYGPVQYYILSQYFIWLKVKYLGKNAFFVKISWQTQRDYDSV